MKNKEDDDVEEYLRKSREVPLLSAEEERTLAEAARAGDTQARERLINANLRLVVHIAKCYQRRGLPLWDLIQEGNAGLIKAAKKFDPTRGFRFSTCATWWIKQPIRRALQDTTRLVRIPVHVQEVASKLKRIRDAGDRRNALNALGKDLRAGVAGLLDGPHAKGIQDIDAVWENGASITDPETLKFRDEVETLLPALGLRERVVVKLRYGLRLENQEWMEIKDPVKIRYGDALTLGGVGEQLGVTRERVRQIETKALAKMREYAKRKLKKR